MTREELEDTREQINASINTAGDSLPMAPPLYGNGTISDEVRIYDNLTIYNGPLRISNIEPSLGAVSPVMTEEGYLRQRVSELENEIRELKDNLEGKRLRMSRLCRSMITVQSTDSPLAVQMSTMEKKLDAWIVNIATDNLVVLYNMAVENISCGQYHLLGIAEYLEGNIMRRNPAVVNFIPNSIIADMQKNLKERLKSITDGGDFDDKHRISDGSILTISLSLVASIVGKSELEKTIIERYDPSYSAIDKEKTRRTIRIDE